jgi:hypothetical protein
MALALAAVSISTRRKLTSILLSVTIFALLVWLTTLAIGRPVIFGIIHAIFVGTGVGFFEEFYVQSPRGRWLRSMHPVRSIFLYTIVVLTLYVIAVHLSHVVLWRFEDLAIAYRKLPIAIPIVMVFSVIGIMVMRTVHFIGIETLFHLMLGTYHRPVIQKRSCCFSTSIIRQTWPSGSARSERSPSSVNSCSTCPNRSPTTVEISTSIKAMA